MCVAHRTTVPMGTVARRGRAQAWSTIPGIEPARERTVDYVARDALAFDSSFRALMKASAVTFSPSTSLGSRDTPPLRLARACL